MKTILIIFNILLGCAVLFGGIRFFRSSTGNTKAGFSVKKRKSAGNTAKIKKTEPVHTNHPVNLDELSKTIHEANIFNQERCPNIGFNSNARVELTLVGTFTTGKVSGAIIMQKSQSRNMMPFMPPGGPNGMNNAGGSGRHMGIERGGGMGGNFNQQEATNHFQQSNTRRQIGGARTIRSMRNSKGLVVAGTTNSTLSTNQAKLKQYVRLGETLANGYKLVEVERTRVTLLRGTDRIELELADASQNAPKRAAPQRRANFGQVMQQMMNTMQNMQRAQGFQNFQMMRAMQNMNRNQNNGGGPRRR